MSDASDASREHEPSQKKLDDARRRGDVVQAAELTAAGTYGAFLAIAAGFGSSILAAAGSVAAGMLGNADRLAAQIFFADRPVLSGLVAAAIWPFLPVVLVPAAAAILVLAAQKAIVVAPERIAPRLSKIDPFAAARHRFGVEGLADFAKSSLKLVAVAIITSAFLLARIEELIALQRLDPGPATVAMARITAELLVILCVISAVAGTAEYLLQRQLRLRRNRMSRQELMEELRESEGDPHIRMQRRRRAGEIALARTLADVPKADVVIANPTHFAVALRWNRASRRAPVCVAKGADAMAARIREVAAVAGVPVRSDPPTARALYASVDVGEEIRPEHYRAVAAAIRFAEEMRRRARARGW